LSPSLLSVPYRYHSILWPA